MSKSATHSTAAGRAAAFKAKSCEGKARLSDKKAATSFLNAFKKNRGRHGRPEKLRSYYCHFCRGWHVTKKL